jgi:hypothetical protein
LPQTPSIVFGTTVLVVVVPFEDDEHPVAAAVEAKSVMSAKDRKRECTVRPPWLWRRLSKAGATAEEADFADGRAVTARARSMGHAGHVPDRSLANGR